MTLDFRACTPDLAQLLVRKELQLVCAIWRSRLRCIAVADQRTCARGTPELDDADVRITAKCDVFAFHRRSVGNHAECTVIAACTIRGNIDVVSLQTIHVSPWHRDVVPARPDARRSRIQRSECNCGTR